MTKNADTEFTCRQCGRKFVFTKAEQEFYEQKDFRPPRRCSNCRRTKEKQLHRIVCGGCGTELKESVAILCASCREVELEQMTKQSQKAASDAQAELIIAESQKAELAESLRQKEQMVAELEMKVSSLSQKASNLGHKINTLSQDLEKAHQFDASIAWIQSSLNRVAEHLEALEQGQHLIKQRMLDVVRIVHEKYENISFLEIIKRRLKPVARD